jgi:hypothetical protein
MAAVLLAGSMAAGEPRQAVSAVKACDRSCLIGIMDGYMNAVFQHDPNSASA